MMDTMTYRMANSLAYREIPFALKHNREHANPFAVYCTGFKPDSQKHKILLSGSAKLGEPTHPVMDITTEGLHQSLFYLLLHARKT